MLRKPKIIILDEIDANIESRLFFKIITFLRGEQLGIILINHKQYAEIIPDEILNLSRKEK